MLLVPLSNHLLQGGLKFQKSPGRISSKENPGCGNVSESCGDRSVGFSLVLGCDAEEVRAQGVEIAETKNKNAVSSVFV